jgi:hypothetical protein
MCNLPCGIGGVAVKIWVVALGAVLLSGCADYMNNRDSITLGVGDAPQANLAMQTIDPFPPDAKNTDIRIDPEKVAQAYEKYIAGPQQQGGGGCSYGQEFAADGSRCGGRASDLRAGGLDPGDPGVDAGKN